MLRRAWGAEAAGCRQGGRFVCGGAIGQRPRRTENIHSMFVTCATSQEPMGPLKVERHGASYTRLDRSVTALAAKTKLDGSGAYGQPCCLTSQRPASAHASWGWIV